jgi:putative phage-type endonuclease
MRYRLAPDNYQEWIQDRLNNPSIGASQSSAVMGLNPYQSAVDVYFDLVDGFEQDDNLAMYLGREMEPIIKKLFMERTGLKVLNDNKIRIDQEYDFLTTNLDGMVVGEGVPVEYKTSGMPWTGDIPEHYFVQIQHQMMVTESPSIYFVSLSMGLRKQLVVEKYDRDDEFISEMRKELVSFWHDHILTRTPPEPESLDDAKKRYTEIDPESVATATPDDQLIWATMNTLKEERKVIDEQIKDHQLNLIKKIGERESLVSLSGNTLVTWKRTKDSVVFDTQRFAKEKPDLYNKYMRTRSGYRRFILKEDIND